MLLSYTINHIFTAFVVQSVLLKEVLYIQLIYIHTYNVYLQQK